MFILCITTVCRVVFGKFFPENFLKSWLWGVMCKGCTWSFFFHLSAWLIILQWWISFPHQSNLIKKTRKGRFWVHPFLHSSGRKGEYHGWHHIKTMQMWTSEVASELQNCLEDTWWELFDPSDIEHNTFAVLSYIAFCAVTVTVTQREH